VAQYRAERRRSFVNWAALLTWAAALAFCFLVLGKLLQVHLFFMWLPGYLLALVLYTGLSALAGAGEKVEAAPSTSGAAGAAPAAPRASELRPNGGSMPRWRKAARALAAASLAAIIGAALARALTGMDANAFHVMVNVSTLVWFASGTLWLTPGLFGIPEEAKRGA